MNLIHKKQIYMCDWKKGERVLPQKYLKYLNRPVVINRLVSPALQVTTRTSNTVHPGKILNMFYLYQNSFFLRPSNPKLRCRVSIRIVTLKHRCSQVFYLKHYLFKPNWEGLRWSFFNLTYTTLHLTVI